MVKLKEKKLSLWLSGDRIKIKYNDHNSSLRKTKAQVI